MSRRLGVLGALAILAVACGGASGDAAEGDGTLTAAGGEPIAAGDFSDDLSKSFIQGTHDLSKDAFEAKWKASRSDKPIMFFRAYPGAYHKDFATNLKAGARAKI